MKEKKRIKKNKEKLLKIKSATKILSNDYEAINFWSSGFKRIRLFVIEETLKQLEIEINNSLTSLGLVDWKLLLDIERENKSGSVTKGFSVLVSNSENKKPVRFESWSGGETQRLRLAGDLGLANLIMERTGFINKIEFIDEPCEYLSREGINDLLESLHERAINEDKKIFLADHNILEFGDFEGTLSIIKDKSGSNFKFKKAN